MWEDFASAAETSDWQSPELARHAADEALSVLSRGLYADHYNGVVTKGEPVFDPEVSSVDPPGDPTTVMIADCADTTDWLVYDAETGELADDQSGGQQACSQLRLGSPQVGVSPAADQLVHLPTWLWIEPGSWGEVSATASVPGVTVTATATPVSVSWSMGDGGTFTCDDPGTPFHDGADPASSSPDCGHTYRTSSAGQPGEVFDVIATVQWTVTWSGAGESGVRLAWHPRNGQP